MNLDRNDKNRESLSRLAQEYVWLWDFRHGLTTEYLAERDGMSHKTVVEGINNAAGNERG